MPITLQVFIAAAMLLPGVAGQMTCTDAVGVLGQIDQRCPKNCESQDGVCPSGMKERDPNVCGASVAPNCGSLKEVLGSKTQIQSMVDGLKTCTGQFAGYAAYGDYGVDYLMYMYLANVFTDCGFASPYAPAPLNTCMGAVVIIGDVDKRCPKNCDEAQATDGVCSNGMKERDPNTCGAQSAPNCKSLIDDLANTTFVESMVAGLNTCTGQFAQYAQYGAMGTARFAQWSSGLMVDCGYRSGTETTCGAVKKAYNEYKCCGNPTNVAVLAGGMTAPCADVKAGYKTEGCCGKPEKTMTLPR
jgi:hypothetical protein